MSIYYTIFIVSFLLCIFDFIKESKIKLFVFVLFTTIVTLIAGLRPIGIDNDSIYYAKIFLNSENLTYSQILYGDYWENIEKGYFLLNKFIFSIGGDANILLLIVSILMAVLNYSIIYKISPYPFISLLFYLSFFYLYRDFTQIRYGLSCAIAFYAVYYLINSRKFLFLMFLMLSILFHNTSYILLLALPFCYYIKNKFVYFFLPVIGFVGFFYNILPFVVSKGIGGDHMELYLGEEGGAGFAVSFVGAVIMLIYIFNEKKLLSNERTLHQYKMLFRLFSISVTFNFLFFQIAIFQRFTYLFFQFGVLLLPMVLYDLHHKKNKYRIGFKAAYFLFACFFLYYGLKMIDQALIRPYFTSI